MDSILQYVTQEWTAMKAAPAAFVAAVVLMGAMIFWFVRWIYKERIETLRVSRDEAKAAVSLIRADVDISEKKNEGLLRVIQEHLPTIYPSVMAAMHSRETVIETLEKLVNQGRLFYDATSDA